jgi:deoxyribose-phosphate aldolase
MIALNRYIDHTLLHPAATPAAINQLCVEAIEYNFKAVCVNSANVVQAAKLVKGHNVRCASTTGFPLGAVETRSKVAEAYMAMCNGADEIDMVLNIGWAKAGMFGEVVREIDLVKEAIGVSILKVIIETAYLDEAEIVHLSDIVGQSGADFIKTSTGFAPSGARLSDIRLIKKTVGDRLKIKASGGIKTGKEALGFIAAGAHRIGTSSGVRLMETTK